MVAADTHRHGEVVSREPFHCCLPRPFGIGAGMGLGWAGECWGQVSTAPKELTWHTPRCSPSPWKGSPQPPGTTCPCTLASPQQPLHPLRPPSPLHLLQPCIHCIPLCALHPPPPATSPTSLCILLHPLNPLHPYTPLIPPVSITSHIAAFPQPRHVCGLRGAYDYPQPP